MIALSRLAYPALLAVAIVAAVPAFDGDCCQDKKNVVAKTDVTVRATTLLASWKAVPERMVALTAEAKQELDAAQAVMARCCPVCKEQPATFAYLKDAFAADAVAMNHLMKACHGGDTVKAGAEKGCGSCPMKGEVAHGSMALELINFAVATKSAKSDCCAQTEKKEIDCCAAKDAADPLVQLNQLVKRGADLEKTWSETIPATFAALSGPDREELTRAIATSKKINPRVPVMIETMSVLREMVSQPGCCAELSKEDGSKAVQPLMSARAELRKKAVAVLAAMEKICAGGETKGEVGQAADCCQPNKVAAGN